MEISLNPLDQLDPLVIGATVLIFGATFVALRKVFVLPYIQVMEGRRRLFEDADARGTEATQTLQAGEGDAKAQLAEAREAADAMLREATERTDAYRRGRLEEATRAASDRLEQGRARIEAAKRSELTQLRQEAVDCVGLACDQLLGESDAAAVEAAVDRLLARRVH